MATLCESSKDQEMMNLESRIQLMAKLGSRIQKPSELRDEVIQKAINRNPWFTKRSVNQALDNIAGCFLDVEALERWSSAYDIRDRKRYTIGLIMAGNIPAVGFHDMLSVFISGHVNQIKLSDKDNILLPYLVDELIAINPDVSDYFHFVDRLKDYDAVIATGSNTAGNYFERYFSSVPHIIRKNMNGVAIINKDISDEDLESLGHDIFDFFGLGCRNVSKLYIEKGFEIHRLFNAVLAFSHVIDHHKYKNNYDYNNALYLINREDFLTNNFFALKKDKNISSRIATVHYEYYDDLKVLESKLILDKDKIQCLVSNNELDEFECIRFGNTQKPLLDQYADNVDTLKFLSSLS
ncbi:MAG: acyl-CoA reductase [Bacteroidia bacterium]|nr:acyl-CoA reductase [Bacteroidia bacterium]